MTAPGLYWGQAGTSGIRCGATTRSFVISPWPTGRRGWAPPPPLEPPTPPTLGQL